MRAALPSSQRCLTQAASLAAGAPRQIEHTRSFVDGIGGKSVLEEMWPLIVKLLDQSVVVPLDQVAAAVRTLCTRVRVVAEGAGATPLAAALNGSAGGGRIVCVVSGGNIDETILARILNGEVP